MGDLYRHIDWSDVDERYIRWAKGKKIHSDKVERFRRQFRLVLLEHAFLHEGELRQQARYLLVAAGVWPQVVDFYEKHGLLPDAAAPRPESPAISENGKGVPDK